MSEQQQKNVNLNLYEILELELSAEIQDGKFALYFSKKKYFKQIFSYFQ